MSNTVLVLTLPDCGPCTSVVSAYRRAAVPVQVRDMATDPDAEALARSLGYTGSPITVVLGERGQVIEHFKDYRPERVRQVIRSQNTACSAPVP